MTDSPTYEELAAPSGASLVGFAQSGEGCRPRNVLEKLREIITPEDFGAIGDGTRLLLTSLYPTLADAQVDYPFLTANEYSEKTLDYAAMRGASIECAATGKTLVLRGDATYGGARLEVHRSFDVIGNGATIEYLGIGNTLIAGTGSGSSAQFTAWPANDVDAMADRYPVTSYALAQAAAAGSGVLVLGVPGGPGAKPAADLQPGMLLFLADNPAPNSSVTNAIPIDFEFATVKSVSGNTVTLAGQLRNSYGSSAVAFYSEGVARNCKIADLRINTIIDAYQIVGRSAYDVVIENVEFVGDSAFGAFTFSQNVICRNFSGVGYSALSTARGTVSFMLDGFRWQPRQTSNFQPFGFFLEESAYRVDLRNMDIRSGFFTAQSFNCFGGQGKRLLTISNSVIDVPGDSPFQCGTVTGIDIVVTDCVLSGAATLPDPHFFPGNIPASLAWISGTQTGDRAIFTNCRFVSSFPGLAFSGGGATQGKVVVDDNCEYVGCSRPADRHLQGGEAITPVLLSGWGAMPSAFQQPTYRIDAQGYGQAAGIVAVQGASDASPIFVLPVGQRPATQQPVAFSLYGGTSDASSGFIYPTGEVAIGALHGATAVGVDQLRWRVGV